MRVEYWDGYGSGPRTMVMGHRCELVVRTRKPKPMWAIDTGIYDWGYVLTKG